MMSHVGFENELTIDLPEVNNDSSLNEELTKDELEQLRQFYTLCNTDSDFQDGYNITDIGRPLVLVQFLSRSKGKGRKRKYNESITFIYDKLQKTVYRVVEGEIKNANKSWVLNADQLVYEALGYLPENERTAEKLLKILGY